MGASTQVPVISYDLNRDTVFSISSGGKKGSMLLSTSKNPKVGKY